MYLPLASVLTTCHFLLKHLVIQHIFVYQIYTEHSTGRTGSTRKKEQLGAQGEAVTLEILSYLSRSSDIVLSLVTTHRTYRETDPWTVPGYNKLGVVWKGHFKGVCGSDSGVEGCALSLHQRGEANCNKRLNNHRQEDAGTHQKKIYPMSKDKGEAPARW